MSPEANQNVILEKLEERLPRYTSYPAAPHFAEVLPKTHRKWLKNITSDNSLSLYIHIPYCQQLCWFCGCNTSVANSYKPINSFMSALVQEIQLLSSILDDSHQLKVRHIHFGGGSPTLLSSEDFDRLMGVLAFQFNLSDMEEIAIEMDPRTLSEEKIETYAKHGVKRASIGVQDFDEAVQKAINRVQSEEMIFSAFETLRKYGINKINMDLIFGLPQQTLEGVIKTAKKAVKLDPSRISLFPYAHVPWMKKHQLLINEEQIPKKEIRLKMADAMRQVFLDAGYIAIGMDHFAKPDDSLISAKKNKRLKRNFQGYSDDEADVLIGLGPSAISKLPDGYVQNQPNTKHYQERIWQDELASYKGHGLSNEDKIFGAVIEELMCHYSVDLEEIAKTHGKDTDIFSPSLERLFAIEGIGQSGLIKIDNDKISISEENPVLVRAVASRFDQYLPEGNVETETKQYSKLA
ncbi:MAG: oxygen-independent coproporphyrinogen III oxidase [Sphingomonadales bacterium]|nr:oxygen-independent coproporphyrinogen III oxidase [Sphingomonadales bacterium]